jgi:hypothetical protein
VLKYFLIAVLEKLKNSGIVHFKQNETYTFENRKLCICEIPFHVTENNVDEPDIDRCCI